MSSRPARDAPCARRLRAAACSLGCLVFLACEARVAPHPVVVSASTTDAGPLRADVLTLQGKTMGTSYHIKVVVRGPQESARASALHADIDALLERVNDEMSTYREESELSRFNRFTDTAAFPVSPGTAAVTRRALELGRHTEGAFDVTLGPLIALWGFDRGGPRADLPSDAELRAARARVGLSRLHVIGEALQKDQADLFVNLSGIAKGWGVDQVYERLRAAGFSDVMVEIGGEVRASGLNARGEPWRIGINVPRSDADPEAVLLAVPLADAALATSGDYRNYFESGGDRYAHILDPTTGAPARRELVSASILAADCTTADGLATAAIVLGEERTRAVLSAHFPGVEAFFVHRPAPGQAAFRTGYTAGFPAALAAPPLAP